MLKRNGLKISIIVMACIAAVVGLILILVISATNSLVANMLFAQSQTANQAFSETFAQYQSQALERAEMIAGSAEIVAAVETGDHARLLRALNNFSVGLDLITLCDAQGNVLARTHNDKVGDSVLNQEAISAALSTGKGIKTIEPGTVIGLSTRGSAAIKDADGRIIGALTCGHDLSQPKYVDAIKAQNSCEATFFAGDERMNTTLFDDQGNRAVGTKADAAIADIVLNKKQTYTGRITLFDGMYEAHYTPVIVGSQAIGMLFTGVRIEDTLAQERSTIVMIVLGVFLLLLSVLITAMIIRWITKKIHWYESMLDSIPMPISVTDMNMKWTFINKPVEDMLKVRRADVLGKPCSNWGAAICNTANCGITCLRNKKPTTFFDQMGMDFRVDTNYLTENGKNIGHIEVVQDITQMIKNQKAQARLVAQIGEVSGAFTSGSKQIATGSQVLAQGATEQSVAIQQLSGTISEITEKTQNNSSMAGKAALLAETIKGNAEKGSEQMSQMIQAVREINEASQSISNVMKTIDDIAFQTNILALNAAVEAARAGVHGKGFAVVADEVRNLSAKSAVAAKDTDALIHNAMEKAAIGARIADGTAASLSEIVSGIDESSQIVQQIAKASKDQSISIAEINRGVEQVAQIVQQNSASAQEFAAASQEMNGQAEILDNLVSNFDADTDTAALDAPKAASQPASPALPSSAGGVLGKY